MPDTPLYSFGPFRFDPATGRLTRGAEPVPLTPKAAEVLRVLIEGRGGLVTRRQLLDQLWAGISVDHMTIDFHIHRVRRALGDDARAPLYLQTLARRGYQFVAPVTVLPAPVDPAVTGLANGSDERRDELGQPTSGVSAVDRWQPAEVVGERSEAPAGPLAAPARSAWRRARALKWIAAGLLALVATLVVAGNLGESPVPRVVRMTPLTHDGTANYSDMWTFDGSRLIVTKASTNTQHLIRMDGTGSETPEILEDFRLLDVSKRRNEAIAFRPRDPGAENGLWIVPLDGRRPERLGTVMTTGFATWSNEADRIAYSWTSGLRIVQRDSGQVTELPMMAGVAGWPRWSPDDRSLRVTVHTASNRTNTSTLWDFHIETGVVTKVLDHAPVGLICCGRWLTGQNAYAFWMGDEHHGQFWLLRETNSMFRAPRRELVALTEEQQRFISPLAPSENGNRIFVLKQDTQLSRYDFSRREFAPYLNGINASAVDFSRDGVWITYVDNRYVLWRARTDGSDAKTLTSLPFKVTAGTWSPDGTMLAIRGQVPGKQAKVYLLPASGGEPRPLSPDNVAQGIPSWSRDGRQLTFGDVPEQFGVPTGSERVHFYDLTTRTMEDLPESAGLWTSRWSPDGRYIAALTIEKRELRLYDLTTGKWRSLNAAHANHPAWSRDSKYLYLDPEGPEPNLRRVRIADGRVETVLDLSKYGVPWAGITPDGSALVLRRLSDIYALELERR